MILKLNIFKTSSEKKIFIALPTFILQRSSQSTVNTTEFTTCKIQDEDPSVFVSVCWPILKDGLDPSETGSEYATEEDVDAIEEEIDETGACLDEWSGASLAKAHNNLS